jgi:hypothetical protein
MATINVAIEENSRYKKTALYTKDGKTFWGIWNKPSIVLDGDEEIVTIKQSWRGTLDFLADARYDDRSLFWAIASINGIANIAEEVVPGLRVIVPKIENIKAALLDSTNA